MDTNLTSMITGTRALIRNGYLRGKQIGLRAQRSDGHDQQSKEIEASVAPVIINVSSLLGLQGGYGAVAYAASKAGVLGFTRALATEYAAHGVRVNAIVPGYVETDMTKGTSFQTRCNYVNRANIIIRPQCIRTSAAHPIRTIREAGRNRTSSTVPS